MAIADKVDLINIPTYLFFFATPLILFYLTSTSPVYHQSTATSLPSSSSPPDLLASGGGLVASRHALAGVAPGIGLCALETRHMLLESVNLFKNTTSE
jgi:hypothetical protein